MPRDKRAEIASRRVRVAQLALRGLTQREIVRVLAHPPHSISPVLNPDTKKPYDLATINRDLKALRKEWRKRSAEATDEHRALTLAKLDEVERAAWAKTKLAIVLKALDQKAGIYGIKAPEKQAVTGEVIFRVIRDEPGSDNPPAGAASEPG